MHKRFDFIMHWLWAIVWSLLALSGFSMMGAKYGWLLNYDYALAIDIHRTMAAVFVLLTFLSIAFEIVRTVRKKTQKLPWFIFGRSGYQLFTFITALILIITGAIVWACSELEIETAAIALMFHEYVSYLTLASVIWHIYIKSHALITNRAKSMKAEQGAG